LRQAQDAHFLYRLFIEFAGIGRRDHNRGLMRYTVFCNRPDEVKPPL
jgi:hypothetical protein